MTESGNPPRGILIEKCDELGTENWVGEKNQRGNKNILEDEIAWQEETLDGGSTLSLPLSYAQFGLKSLWGKLETEQVCEEIIPTANNCIFQN